MLTKIISSSIYGIDSYLVDVEVNISRGLPSFTIVGMTDKAIMESKERVKTSVVNSGYEIKPKKIVVNLSPAGIKKERGVAFDLPIAIGILSSYKEIDIEKKVKDYMILGELSLSGQLKKINGVINSVYLAKEKGLKGVIVPRENYFEAKMISKIEVIPVSSLKECINFLEKGILPELPEVEKEEKVESKSCFSEVKGQIFAKRALEIAAAGNHNVLMIGSPGCGKSMLAKRTPTIMPELGEEEMIEVAKIYSSVGLFSMKKLVAKERPFRSPHHSSSDSSIIGGGMSPRAGEISLAHRGVLFLDEALEYNKNVLESLRQPLEDKKVTVSRASYSVNFPADFLLIMATNPCPCGYLFEEVESTHRCICTRSELDRYKKKLSGPISDRIDLYMEMKKLKKEELLGENVSESSEKIKERVVVAREIQLKRGKKLNSNLSEKEIEKYCKLDKETRALLEQAVDLYGLTGRGYTKTLKVARTIADLDESKNIELNHLMEALSYRKKD